MQMEKKATRVAYGEYLAKLGNENEKIIVIKRSSKELHLLELLNMYDCVTDYQKSCQVREYGPEIPEELPCIRCAAHPQSGRRR